MKNEVKIQFLSKSENESFARMSVAALMANMDPTVEELADVKTAVSEAVTNAIIHGYANSSGIVYMECSIDGDSITITIKDNGKGIENIKEAMEPMFTTNTDGERSGMGFSVMETFTDRLFVGSRIGKGTRVNMIKRLS